MKWLANDPRVNEPLLYRPILNALRLSTGTLVAPAADWFSGSVDAERLVKKFVWQEDGTIVCKNEDNLCADGIESIKKSQKAPMSNAKLVATPKK